MTNIKILGSGCPNCRRLEALVRETIEEMSLQAEIEKVTDYGEIMQWGVMSTPGLVLDGKVVSTGRIPSRGELAQLLESNG